MELLLDQYIKEIFQEYCHEKVKEVVNHEVIMNQLKS